GERAQQLPLLPAELHPLEGEERAAGEGTRGVDDRVRVEHDVDPGAPAGRTGPLAAVEGEETRVEGREAEGAARTEEPLGEKALRAVREHDHRASPVAEGTLEGFLERPCAGLDGGNDQVDVVLAVAIEEAHVGEGDPPAIDAGLAQPELPGA